MYGTLLLVLDDALDLSVVGKFKNEFLSSKDKRQCEEL